MSNLALTNHFLIAMPDMVDPYFSATLSLICEHNTEGAMGFIVNRPMDLHAADLFEQQDIEFDPASQFAGLPLHMGGPVQQEQGFILHSGEKSWETTLTVSDDFKITSSRDIIADIAAGEGPDNFIILLGYAGWGAGQLETEILANSWLTSESDPEIVFKLPIEQRWHAAANSLGIDLNLISTDSGHA